MEPVLHAAFYISKLTVTNNKPKTVSYNLARPKLKIRKRFTATNLQAEMPRQVLDTRGHHFLLDGDSDILDVDVADDQSHTASPSLDWIETEDSRFLCVLCGKTYRSKNVLYNHRSVYHRSEYKKNANQI